MFAVAHVLGVMMAFFGIVYVLPIGWSLAVRDGAAIDFVVAAVINVVAGLAVAAATRRFRRELKPRDGFLLVSLSWALMSASASIPFMIAMPDLSFTDAYFEAVSGHRRCEDPIERVAFVLLAGQRIGETSFKSRLDALAVHDRPAHPLQPLLR